MSLINQIEDAIKYTLRDWKAIVLLGIIICISDTAYNFETKNEFTLGILFFITLVLLFFEEGYRFQIISETLKGRNSPPNHTKYIQSFKRRN